MPPRKPPVPGVEALAARYRGLAEATGQIIWLGDAAGAAQELSGNWEVITGHSRDVVFSGQFFSFVHPDDMTWLLPLVLRSIEEGKAFDAEFRFRHAGGHYLTFRSRNVPVVDAAGAVRERIGTFLDITAVKEAQRRKAASDKRFADTFHTSRLPMVIRRVEDFCIIDVNDAWLALAGCTREETIGTPIEDAPWSTSRERARAFIETFLIEGRVRQRQTTIRRKDGRQIPTVAWAEPIDILGERCMLVSLEDISDKLEAERMRQASEELFHTAFYSAPLPQAVRDYETLRLTEVNEAWLRFMGYSRDEVIGLSPGEMPMLAEHGDWASHAADIFKRDGTVRDFPGTYRRKSGDIAHGLVSADKVMVGGRPHALITIVDVTARMSAEAGLAASEERFRVLSEAAWEGIALVEHGKIFDANQQLARMLGYEHHELIGMPVADLTAPLSRPQVARNIRERAVSYEHEALRKDGSAIVVEVSARDVPYQGRTVRMSALRDITARKREDLRRRELVAGTAGVLGEDFFHSLAKHLSAALEVKCALVAEVAGPVQNRLQTLSVWIDGAPGLPRETVIAGTVAEQVLLNGRRLFEKGVQPLFPHDTLLRDVEADSYAGIPLIDSQGVTLGVLAVAHDRPLTHDEDLLSILTVFGARAGVELERIRADARIGRLNAELEQRVASRTAELQAANRELEAFSYSVSHDLRAPVRHMAGFVALLARELGQSATPGAQEYIAEIADSASRMGVLIDDLLEFSRVGRAGLHRTRVSLADMAADVVAEFTRHYPDRRIEWTVGALPTVAADPKLMRQVFLNLASNAVKYTRPREVARIEFGAAKDAAAGQAVFYVRDNGVGFDMAHAHKLFGVFQRLHSHAVFEGTGIGLAHVQRIVHRHGGRVWAESGIDAGATFHVALPVDGVPEDPA